MAIRIFVTGGTLDKDYDALAGELGFGETHLVSMLEQARVSGRITVTSLLMKDSLDMNNTDRSMIADAVEAASEDRIIVIHGTDTMVKSGLTIQRRKIPRKTIILTGAMVPYSFGVTSDAQFNLGTAIAFAKVLAEGTYIAMNGQSFSVDDVHKDKHIGRFEANA